MWMRLAVLFGIIVLASAGCGPGDTAFNSGSTASVTVDLFYGRPNPVWDLSADDAAEIARLIEQLPTDGEAGSINDKLLASGFRRFIVRGLILPRLGDHEQVTVFTDQVVIEKAGQDPQTLPDAEGSVHAALRAKAKAHVSDEIYEVIPE